MLTTLKVLRALKKANGDCSDYRIAKLLGVSTSTVSKWTCKRGTMSEETAKKAAELLGMPPGYVVACIHAEQHQGDEIYPVWQAVCRTLEPRPQAA